MKERMIYEAPETEAVEVKVEKAFLNLSGGAGTATANKMSSSSWDSWDTPTE